MPNCNMLLTCVVCSKVSYLMVLLTFYLFVLYEYKEYSDEEFSEEEKTHCTFKHLKNLQCVPTRGVNCNCHIKILKKTFLGAHLKSDFEHFEQTVYVIIAFKCQTLHIYTPSEAQTLNCRNKKKYTHTHNNHMIIMHITWNIILSISLLVRENTQLHTILLLIACDGHCFRAGIKINLYLSDPTS